MGELPIKKKPNPIVVDEIRKFLAENRKRIMFRIVKRLKKEKQLKEQG